MTCDDYEIWIAENLDDVLTGALDDPGCATPACDRCSALRERHQGIHDTFRSGLLVDPAPPWLRTRILARLEDSPTSAAPVWSSWWQGLLAAGVVAGLVIAISLPSDATALDPLVGTFRAVETREPGALQFRSADPAELARLYGAELGRPEVHVLDLEGIGLRLVGGEIQEIAGQTLRVSVYEYAGRRVLCQFVPASMLARLDLAEGERRSFTHRGLFFCLTRVGDEVCVLVTASPSLRARLV